MILSGMDGANALAHNWLRAAVDAIVDRAHQRGHALPSKALETFLADDRHDGQARWLAYDLLVRQDPSMRERYLPRLIDDRNLDLRRESVARVLDDADRKLTAGQRPEAGRSRQPRAARRPCREPDPGASSAAPADAGGKGSRGFQVRHR